MATPYDAHTELLRSVISREGALGSLGIVGLPPLKEGEEEDVSKLTTEDMDVVRRILINPDRAEALPYMAETLLGPSNEDGIPPMYDKRVLAYIQSEIPKQLERIDSLPTLKLQFSNLFALTYYVKDYDSWFINTTDPEGAAAILHSLGGRWKALLASSDAALGIDTEFTRRGMEALLSILAEHIQEANATKGHKFEFQWS